jgi:hypothetical protein
LAAAVLTRWWGRVWIQGLQDSLEQQRRMRRTNAGSGKTPLAARPGTPAKSGLPA